jgi:hypothetical protein
MQYYTADIQLALVSAPGDVDEAMWERVGGVAMLYDMDNVCRNLRVLILVLIP